MQELLNAIETHGLVKRFGKTTALAGVDLTARTGSVLGLLGPERRRQDHRGPHPRHAAAARRRARATVSGYDVVRDAHQVRQLIGLTGQYASVDEGLSGTNNLIMIGRLLGMPARDARARAAELLRRFELTDAAGRRGEDLLRRHAPPPRPGRQPGRAAPGAVPGRADHRPRPAQPQRGLGHDPASWSRDGTTVLLTTQYLEEADQLAHDIAVIDHGTVIATGTPDELKARAGRQVLEVTPASRADVARGRGAAVSALTGATPCISAESGRGHRPGRRRPAAAGDRPRRSTTAGIELAEFALRKASLDEVFLALTGHRAEETAPRKRTSARAGRQHDN